MIRGGFVQSFNFTPQGPQRSTAIVTATHDGTFIARDPARPGVEGVAVTAHGALEALRRQLEAS